NFSRTVDVALETSRTGQAMVDAALTANSLLSSAQQSRLDDIEGARQWEGVLGPIGVLFALGIIFLAVLVRQTQKQISDAYALVSSSIDYAQHIQRSILPANEQFASTFDAHFIIWEPRDKVGGDFYALFDWGKGSLVVLADCTGHGVPGAFMSLIAMSSIETALDEVKPGDVATLVQRIHQRVRATTGRNRSLVDADDGLELGAMYIDEDKKEASFCGARFSVFVSDPKKENFVYEIKGSRKGIGYESTPDTFDFSSHPIELTKSTQIYMTTDGYIDQVGGDFRRMFGKKRFMDLLRQIRKSSVDDQKEIILRNLKDYQGNETRRDDVSMLGLRF
ncbi:MAG: SpoIIE family protein phosphatase, partial [Gimesia sp.]|nr:SpoIIE family protein phosphatase [Gimesia sp.]